jgi:hypothetical protein
MPTFLTGSPVQDIFTEFFASDVDYDITEDIEYALSVFRQTSAPVERITVLNDDWHMLFFEVLSRHAPNIKHIEYRTAGDGDNEDQLIVKSVK